MRTKQEAAVIIDRRQLLKKLAAIAIPIAIQGLLVGALTFLDNLMVGNLGEEEIAAIGIASQIFSLHYLFVFGINSAAATYMTQFFGSGDGRNIRKVLGFTVTLALAIGAVFFLISVFATDFLLGIWSSDPAIIALARPYVRITSLVFFLLALSSPIEYGLKSTQKPMYAMFVGVVVFASNIFLNYVLIFGNFGAPRLELTGAAIATAAARAIATIIDLILLRREKLGLKGPITDYIGWPRELAERVVRNMLPVVANDVFWSLGTTMYVAAFSRIDTTSYAAYQAALSVYFLFTFATFSVGDAALILIGEKLGEGKREEAADMALFLLKSGAVIGLVAGGLLILTAKPFIALYALSSRGKALGFWIMCVYGATLFLHLSAGICTAGILRGGGDTRYAATGEIATMWLLAVPMAFASAMWWHLPIPLCVLCTVAGDFGTCCIMLRRIRSRKWMKTVIEDL